MLCVEVTSTLLDKYNLKARKSDVARTVTAATAELSNL